MPKATLADVAARAGVSKATVDRALHGRGGVSPANRWRIEKAARELDYHVGLLATEIRPGEENKTFRFIMPRGGSEFLRKLKQGVITSCKTFSLATIKCESVGIEMTPDIMTKEILQCIDDNVDALGLFGFNTSDVADAIDKVVSAGIPVVTFVSDTPPSKRYEFVGLDNHTAGKTAARLFGKFAAGSSGRIATIVGAMSMQDQNERYFGFREVIMQDFRNLAMMPVQETDSWDHRNEDYVRKIAEKHDDLVGIYLTTGGVGGLLTAIKTTKFLRRPIVLAHDLTQQTKVGLLSGHIDAIIDQNVSELTDTLVDYMGEATVPGHVRSEERRSPLPIRIFVSDNIA